MKTIPLTIAQALAALNGEVLPDEAVYVAQDGNGAWWWYTLEPRLYERLQQWACDDDVTDYGLLYLTQPPADCTQEVYRII